MLAVDLKRLRLRGVDGTLVCSLRRYFVALVVPGTMLLLGGCLKDETVGLPWVDAKVESLGSLDNRWAMAFLPYGRLLITEKPGKLGACQRSIALQTMAAATL